MKLKCLIFFLLLQSIQVLAQPYATFKLSKEKLEAGQQVRFVYTGAFSRRIAPRLTLYYNVNGDIRSETLQARYDGKATVGTFTAPDSTLSFNIKARNRRDTSEAFLFFVYKNGAEQKGSRLSATRFTNNNIYGIHNMPKLRQLYLTDFDKYPDLKAKFLLTYYQDTGLPIDSNQTISAELAKIWADSLAHGADEYVLSDLVPLMVRHNHMEQKAAIDQIIEKYPTGISAFQKESMSYILAHKVQSDDYLTDLTAMEIKFSKLVAMGRFDRLYWQIGQHLLKVGDINGAESYIPNMRLKSNQQEWYSSAAYQLLNQGRELSKAEEYIQKAIDMVAYCPSVRYINDPKEWARKVLIEKGTYLDVFAQIEYEMGKPGEAAKKAEAAVQSNSLAEVKEHYLRYLLDAGYIRTALDTASQYVVKDQSSTEIVSLLKEAYAKDKGSETGFENYYQSLLRRADEEYQFPTECKLNVPSIDFALKDIDNKPVTLSNYKGSPVVIYFFSVAEDSKQWNAFKVGFDNISKKYKNRKPVFLLIDRSSVSQTDENSGRPLRIQKIKQFLTQNEVDNKILLDDFHQDTKQSNFSYYRVSDLYSSDSLGQFYVIDKDGMVRYKSFPYYPMNAHRFSRELSTALKLAD